MRFHSDVTLDSSVSNSAYHDFKSFVLAILPEDKAELFFTLLRFPIDTVKLTDETYSALAKVFHAQDPVRQYEFLSEETKNDYLEYWEKDLKYNRFWETTAFDTMKKGIRSFMIVDLPTEQAQSRPEPYMYFLDVRNVIDYKETDGNIEWIVFKMDKTRVAVYCDKYYRVYTKEAWDNYSSSMTPLIESRHDLGYCPAKSFWKGLSPISTQLAQLDWILFFSVSKRFSDLYSPYTIYWGYTEDCDFEDKENGYTCGNGYLLDRNEEHVYLGNSSLMPCPKCSNKINGVGSFIDVPPPDDNTPAMTPPVGKIDVDVSSLDYNVTELKRLEENFYTSVTGNSLESINDKAVNEKQVMSLFESRRQTLLNLKKHYEQAQQWTEETICKLRYGGSFISLHIDYGTKFYLFTAETILEMYTKARESDLDHLVLNMLEDNFLQTKYKNNPIELSKSITLVNLSPLRHVSNTEAKEMYNNNLISFEDYFLKINMSSLIMKFERENGSIAEYLKDVPFSQKIDMIRAVLVSYIVKPIEVNTEKAQLKERLDMYGIGVRAGGITPQLADEAALRQAIGVPEMGAEALKAWEDDEGVRKPITIQSKKEEDATIEQIEQ